MGWILAVTGGCGTIVGGMLADRARRHHPAGRIHVVLIALALAGLFLYFQLTTTSLKRFYVFLGLFNFLQVMWMGPVAASCQDIVFPRMRGTATAAFFLGTTLVGLAFGPYLTGQISDLAGTIVDGKPVGDLRTGILSLIAVAPVALALLVYAYRAVPRAEATIAERAESAAA